MSWKAVVSLEGSTVKRRKVVKEQERRFKVGGQPVSRCSAIGVSYPLFNVAPYIVFSSGSRVSFGVPNAYDRT